MLGQSRLSLPGAGVLIVGVVSGCEPPAPPPAAEQAAAQPAAATRSPWRTLEGSAVIVPGSEVLQELAAAIARARATADEARTRWSRDGGDWAIKWAAPTLAGGVEHVWVRPLSWTRFRIEGVLASPPQAGLACDKGRGELVSFPSEELSDWVRFLDGTPKGSREGGFTMTKLQGRYGSPPATAEAWPASKDG